MPPSTRRLPVVTFAVVPALIVHSLRFIVSYVEHSLIAVQLSRCVRKVIVGIQRHARNGIKVDRAEHGVDSDEIHGRCRKQAATVGLQSKGGIRDMVGTVAARLFENKKSFRRVVRERTPDGLPVEIGSEQADGMTGARLRPGCA